MDAGGWSGWQEIEVPMVEEELTLSEAEAGEGEESDGDQDALPDQGMLGDIFIGEVLICISKST
jgi:hypothetical protein